MARLAAIDVHQGDWARAIDLLKDALAKGPRSDDDMAELQFALGNALDAAGDYPRRSPPLPRRTGSAPGFARRACATIPRRRSGWSMR